MLPFWPDPLSVPQASRQETLCLPVCVDVGLAGRHANLGPSTGAHHQRVGFSGPPSVRTVESYAFQSPAMGEDKLITKYFCTRRLEGCCRTITSDSIDREIA